MKQSKQEIKRKKVRRKKMLFVPFSEDDFLIGNGGVDYLNEIIWTLIEQVNRLEEKVNKLATLETK